MRVQKHSQLLPTTTTLTSSANPSTSGEAVTFTATVTPSSGATPTGTVSFSGVLTAQVLAFAFLIGAIALPGAFLARAFVERMPVHIHTAILDVAVIIGGLVMISAALRQLL